ncbi:adaptor-related protein complex 3, mu 1 subunit [Columba livia]|uniref:Adaptor-related protein complex 3, mu 1 subunit n=2 Tax=Neoaves TaxID=3078114 RepID=A0A2I0MFL1_COLLI|nr:AP-3 complex subunit mu-1 [Columba livia]PKK28465.1 adaptor-related protein complex 3, mu 1 subunit [Columba livia]
MKVNKETFSINHNLSDIQSISEPLFHDSRVQTISLASLISKSLQHIDLKHFREAFRLLLRHRRCHRRASAPGAEPVPSKRCAAGLAGRVVRTPAVPREEAVTTGLLKRLAENRRWAENDPQPVSYKLKSVCDYFFEAQEKAIDVENVPPVISTPHHYLISIYRDKIFFVSVIQTEVPPLFVIEFLHRVADTFQDYFGECSETAIKDNVVIVYELLEEMLDNGFPLATESNILKELIKPPTILRSVVNSITGSSNVGDTLPTGQLSNIPWRRAGVKYTNNEAYFDVIEEIDAIIDKSGSTVFAEIQGDLSLSFMNPRLLDDVSFHPCIRFKRWESERVLSFIPPDGNFRLISYRVSSQNLVAIPVYVKHVISFKENSSSGRFDVTIGPKQNMGKTIEGVVMTVHMPKAVLNMNLTATQGSYTFDPVTKVLTWDVGKITPQKLPNLKGIVNLQSGAPKPEENPSLNIQFKIQQLAISGLKVNRLDMYGEKYKPFKGVKYITKAGKFQVRT